MIDDVEYQLVAYLIRNMDEVDRLADLVDQVREEGDAIFERTNMRGHITASMLVLNHERTHALMIEHLAHKLWLQPGGHVETCDDSLHAAALREVEQETGAKFVIITQQLPLDIDTHFIPARPNKDEGEHCHHDFLYLGQAPQNTTLTAQEDEVGGVKWVPLTDLLESHSRISRVAKKVMAVLEE